MVASLTFVPVSKLSSGPFAGDYNWNTTSNWSPGQIPVAADDVTFASVTPGEAYSTVDDIASLSLGDLSVGAFVRLFIGIGNSLTVDNIITNDGVIQVDNGATLTVAAGGSAAGGAYDHVPWHNGCGRRHFGRWGDISIHQRYVGDRR